MQSKAVLICYQIDCNPKMTKSPRATNTMKIRLSHFGKVKVDYYVYCLDIYAPCKQI
jgi:hypothetical protein